MEARFIFFFNYRKQKSFLNSNSMFISLEDITTPTFKPELWVSFEDISVQSFIILYILHNSYDIILIIQNKKENTIFFFKVILRKKVCLTSFIINASYWPWVILNCKIVAWCLLLHFWSIAVGAITLFESNIKPGIFAYIFLLQKIKKNMWQHSWSEPISYHAYNCYRCGRKLKIETSD